jgi:hypothetical protein
MTALQCSNAVALMIEALRLALRDAKLGIADLDGLVALPSLMAPDFMIGHAVAQQVRALGGSPRCGAVSCTESPNHPAITAPQAGLTPRKGVIVRTIDVGGAGPCAALLQAKHMVESEGALMRLGG